MVTFATAHAAYASPDAAALDVPVHGTLAFYMGLARLAPTCAALVARGRPPETPAVVVSHATLPGERVVRGTLADIAALAEAAALEAPAILLVGEVLASCPVVPSSS
jgi:siroheme synthase